MLLAKKFITEICSYFAELKIPFFLDAGCLLGITRDEELIRWDDDIDFFVIDKHKNETIKLHPGEAITFNDPEKYLSLLYGNWRVPCKDWHFSDFGPADNNQ
jgi:phosphorylcholine metabolism protein LicD